MLFIWASVKAYPEEKKSANNQMEKKREKNYQSEKSEECRRWNEHASLRLTCDITYVTEMFVCVCVCVSSIMNGCRSTRWKSTGKNGILFRLLVLAVWPEIITHSVLLKMMSRPNQLSFICMNIPLFFFFFFLMWASLNH